MNEPAVRAFCEPFYNQKDIMHNLSHIDRLLDLALKMQANHIEADKEMIVYGSYFHGMISNNEREIIGYLKSLNTPANRIEETIQAAQDSLTHNKPASIEGMILHDAHLLEGGKAFLITKCLVTGSVRGQSLSETIRYIEDNILDQREVCLDENKSAYNQMQAYAKNHIAALKEGLNL